MKKTIYLAANKSGQVRVFTTKPERDEKWGLWLGESVGCISTLFMLFEADGMQVPDLKFSDEPIKYSISIDEDDV